MQVADGKDKWYVKKITFKPTFWKYIGYLQASAGGILKLKSRVVLYPFAKNQSINKYLGVCKLDCIMTTVARELL